VADRPAADGGLASRLIRTWEQQGREGFLLSDPATAGIQTRLARDERAGVEFRFRWMPHREIRGDVAELERRGILNPDRDESRLFRDPRDPKGRHCFLCEANIHECHPMERLVPLRLAGRDYYAGANFAWIEENHYTVMPVEHVDQVYSRHALEAMLDLHRQTAGRFRILFNGDGAGATIPWHLHYQITTEAMPIERIAASGLGQYPTTVQRFVLADGSAQDIQRVAQDWLERDSEHHSLNILITTPDRDTHVYLFPRDKRRATAQGKGLVGGFEVAGDFVFSAPRERAVFESASVETARGILGEVRPPGDLD
jgi:hypothetical protein